MKHKRYVLPACVLGPVLLGFTPRGESVAFQPDKGATVSKSFENVSEMTLEDMSMVMNGQEMDPSMMAMELSVTTTTSIMVTDEFVSSDGGRAIELVRHFDELGAEASTAMSNQMMGDMDTEVSSSSELEGLTVVFEWDADSEEYTVEFHEDSGGDDDLLEDLQADMDLAGFLPEDEVSKGDSWEIEPESFRSLLAPGGAMKLEPEGADEEGNPFGGMGNNMPSPDKSLGELEGEASAELTDVRDEDGVRVAVISISFDVSSANDLTELMLAAMEDAPRPDGMEFEMDLESFDIEVAYEGEGTLLWNLEAGILHSFEVSCEATSQIDNAMSISAGGQDMAMEQSMTMAGSMTISGSTTTDS